MDEIEIAELHHRATQVELAVHNMNIEGLDAFRERLVGYLRGYGGASVHDQSLIFTFWRDAPKLVIELVDEIMRLRTQLDDCDANAAQLRQRPL